MVCGKKLDQGHHECEVLGNSRHEAEESSKAWATCAKNPGHPKFIAAQDFSLSDLPKWCRKPLILDYVKRQIAMTVQLRVGYNTWERPEGYCFSRSRGTNLAHFGTGLVKAFSSRKGPCVCQVCEYSSTPSQKCFNVWVSTARHVVYNSEEAKATKVNLFYDDEASNSDGRVKTVWGRKLIEIDDEGDNCILQCITHDELLVKQLKSIDDQYKHLIFKFEGQVASKPQKSWKNLCLIVSHPHGQSKKVTLGELHSFSCPGWLHQMQFTYTTDTCPGSSGAFMLLLEFYKAAKVVSWHTGMMWGAVHSQGGVDLGLNQSGWSNPDCEDWFTPIGVRFSRFMTWALGLTWLTDWYRNKLEIQV